MPTPPAPEVCTVEPHVCVSPPEWLPEMRREPQPSCCWGPGRRHPRGPSCVRQSWRHDRPGPAAAPAMDPCSLTWGCWTRVREHHAPAGPGAHAGASRGPALRGDLPWAAARPFSWPPGRWTAAWTRATHELPSHQDARLLAAPPWPPSPGRWAFCCRCPRPRPQERPPVDEFLGQLPAELRTGCPTTTANHRLVYGLGHPPSGHLGPSPASCALTLAAVRTLSFARISPEALSSCALHLAAVALPYGTVTPPRTSAPRVPEPS